MLPQIDRPPVYAAKVPATGSSILTVALVLCTVFSSACGAPPTAPTLLEPPPGVYRFIFKALNGERGFVGMSVSPKPIPEGTMAADISIRLVGMRPNTTYLVQRAQEGVGGRPLNSDGICQRALGISPWSPSDAPTTNFQTMPLPATGPLVSIATTTIGDAAIDFEFRTLMVMAGTTNDVMFRLVDDAPTPTTEWRSDCLMITAR